MHILVYFFHTLSEVMVVNFERLLWRPALTFRHEIINADLHVGATNMRRAFWSCWEPDQRCLHINGERHTTTQSASDHLGQIFVLDTTSAVPALICTTATDVLPATMLIWKWWCHGGHKNYYPTFHNRNSNYTGQIITKHSDRGKGFIGRHRFTHHRKVDCLYTSYC